MSRPRPVFRRRSDPRKRRVSRVHSGATRTSGPFVDLPANHQRLRNACADSCSESVPDSVVEMRRLMGLQFDPTVMEAFHQLDPDQLAGHTPKTPHATSKPPDMPLEGRIRGPDLGMPGQSHTSVGLSSVGLSSRGASSSPVRASAVARWCNGSRASLDCRAPGEHAPGVSHGARTADEGRRRGERYADR
jgi:hypothetical protein